MHPRFQLVDVFNERPLSGNPLAVVFDADGLSTEAMQEITRWLNLSETAFLCSPPALTPTIVCTSSRTTVKCLLRGTQLPDTRQNANVLTAHNSAPASALRQCGKRAYEFDVFVGAALALAYVRKAPGTGVPDDTWSLK